MKTNKTKTICPDKIRHLCLRFGHFRLTDTNFAEIRGEFTVKRRQCRVSGRRSRLGRSERENPVRSVLVLKIPAILKKSVLINAPSDQFSLHALGTCQELRMAFYAKKMAPSVRCSEVAQGSFVGDYKMWKPRSSDVAWASRPLLGGHPARALAEAGRSRHSGRDAHATRFLHSSRPGGLTLGVHAHIIMNWILPADNIL